MRARRSRRRTYLPRASRASSSELRRPPTAESATTRRRDDEIVLFFCGAAARQRPSPRVQSEPRAGYRPDARSSDGSAAAANGRRSVDEAVKIQVHVHQRRAEGRGRLHEPSASRPSTPVVSPTRRCGPPHHLGAGERHQAVAELVGHGASATLHALAEVPLAADRAGGVAARAAASSPGTGRARHASADATHRRAWRDVSSSSMQRRTRAARDGAPRRRVTAYHSADRARWRAGAAPTSRPRRRAPRGLVVRR